MKNALGAALAQAPWLITLGWIALMILKALVVTHGSLVTAVAVLAGANLFGAAVSAVTTLLWTTFMGVVSAGPVTLVVLKITKASTRVRTGVALAILFSGLLMVLVAPVFLDLIALLGIPVSFVFVFGLGAALSFASGRIGAIHGAARRVRSIPRRSKVALLAFYYFILLVVGVATSGPWMQPERIEANARVFVGYYVGEDSGWTTFLEEDTRQTTLVRTSKIKSRTICWLDSGQYDRALAFTLGGVPPRFLPDCG